MAQSSPKIKAKISVRYEGREIDREPLREAVRAVVQGEAPKTAADVHVVIVDDPTIRNLHRQFFDDDTPTDVITFPTSDASAKKIEGEIVVSLDMAIATAPDYGWSTMDELALYVIHGTLHLLGYDDIEPKEREEMRELEGIYLAQLGIRRRDSIQDPERP